MPEPIVTLMRRIAHSYGLYPVGMVAQPCYCGTDDLRPWWEHYIPPGAFVDFVHWEVPPDA